jgi:dihydroxy-acid dehydratase
MTVTGRTLGERWQMPISDEEVIRRYECRTQTRRAGVLFGNLAPNGAVVKTGGVDPAMMRSCGPARIYESQEDAMRGIMAREVQAGDVVVIRYEGPRGGPGHAGNALAHLAIMGMGLGDKVALITDGRFRAARAGPASGTFRRKRPRAADRRAAAGRHDRDRFAGAHAECAPLRGRNPATAGSPAALPAAHHQQVAARYAHFVTSADTGAVF